MKYFLLESASLLKAPTVYLLSTQMFIMFLLYRVSQKKWRSQNIIVFHELLSLGCINFENLCGHNKEEVLRFPKHPQLVKFG